jgi:hypothetical protein
MRHRSLPVTSRTDCTRIGDGNGDPPPRSRKPGAHRAPSWSSCRPPCFHLPGRGSKDARTKHVTRRPSGPEAARRSSAVAGAPSRKRAVSAAIGCRATSSRPREPLSRFGRVPAICKVCPNGSVAARRSSGSRSHQGEPAQEPNGTRPRCTEVYSIERLNPCNQPNSHDRERRQPPGAHDAQAVTPCQIRGRSHKDKRALAVRPAGHIKLHPPGRRLPLGPPPLDSYSQGGTPRPPVNRSDRCASQPPAL